MRKFHVEMYLIVEAENEDEAEEIAYKLVNSDLPKQLGQNCSMGLQPSRTLKR